ncbi:hypothetical protein IWX49DRAFT_582653 [Phyllosticta citricarpa]|uniref:Secreted protein n=1 Tax=Phyllosticta citricarpa TaxID=55181 RepID=A0ABR1LGB2_9PEZI
MVSRGKVFFCSYFFFLFPLTVCLGTSSDISIDLCRPPVHRCFHDAPDRLAVRLRFALLCFALGTLCVLESCPSVYTVHLALSSVINKHQTSRRVQEQKSVGPLTIMCPPRAGATQPD